MSFTETEADWMSESGTIAQQGHSDDQTWQFPLITCLGAEKDPALIKYSWL